MRVGLFTWVRDWVSMADLLSVQRIALAASGEKSKWKRLSHVWQIVRILTVRRWPFSVFLYPQIVAACNFSGSKETSTDDLETIEKRVGSMASDLASRVNKLPREILTGMAFAEVEVFYKNLLMRTLEKSLSLMSAYHSPVEHGKRTIDKLRKLQNEITFKAKSSAGQIAETFEPVSIKGMFQRFA